MADSYEIRRFRAADKGAPDYAQGTDWLQAVGFGFHDTRRNDEFVDKIMAMYRQDDRELTGVYQTAHVAPHSLGANVPVATFGTLRKDLNVGYGRQLRTHMVTAVTVRGTHRRQGILRRMMTEDLTAAKADGLADGGADGIGRVHLRPVRLRRGNVRAQHQGGHRAPLRPPPRADGGRGNRRPESAPGAWRRKCSNACTGTPRARSSGRTPTGRTSQATVGRDGSEDEAIKCALHYDAAGTVDGYVSYKFAGWDTKPYTMEIVDLVAATDAAYLELWQFLGSIDLDRAGQLGGRSGGRPAGLGAGGPPVHRVLGPPGHALAPDPGHAPGAGRPALLRGRHARPGHQDALGFAGGTFILDVSGGEATVTAEAPAGSEPDLSLDVADLGSIYLGAVCPVTLKAAGRITGAHAGCGAESAAHVRRRTRAALPDAFLTAFLTAFWQVTGLRRSGGALTGVGECD